LAAALSRLDAIEVLDQMPQPQRVRPISPDLWRRLAAHLSFSRGGAELLFQVFADRYQRASILITSNLAFSDWGQVFQGERMTAALLDRLTQRCHIFEMNGESYRFRESVKQKKGKKAE
jgi:hypothetical protein